MAATHQAYARAMARLVGINHVALEVGMGLSGVEKTEAALGELREKGLAG